MLTTPPAAERLAGTTAAGRPIPFASQHAHRSPSRPPAAAPATGPAKGAAGPPARKPGLIAAAVLVALLPAGCGERRDGARLAALEASIASANSNLAVLSGAAPAFRPVSAAPVAAAPVLAARDTPAVRPGAGSALLGATPDALRRWFGEPDLRRPEGGGEVQLYLGPGCALDVVLYADAGGGGMRVFHAAARADGAAAVTEAECLRGIGARAGRVAAAGQSAGR